MIASIRGTILSFTDDTLIVEVGGVGLRLLVPSSVFDGSVGVGRQISLFTHLVVREDSLTLYGFKTEEERTMYETCLSISGVGPKMALAIISTLSPDLLRQAVATEEAGIISRVPGVGKKTAEKIIFNLRGKLQTDFINTGGSALVDETDTEVIAALTALGYSLVEAQTALQNIPQDAPDDVETKIRLALGYFA